MKTLFYDFGQEISVLAIITRIICAIIVGSVIGIEREKKNRPAGLKTHILVCVGATLIASIEQQIIYEVATLANSNIGVSVGRLSVGVVTGVGFIGAGTIMMSKTKIVGLTTAASLWCTACLGVANGMGYSILAILISIVVFIVLEAVLNKDKSYGRRVIEVEYETSSNVDEKISDLTKEKGIQVLDSNISCIVNDGVKYCVSNYTIVIKDNDQFKTIMLDIGNIESVINVKVQNTF